jgi:hypothetical protein
MPIRGLSHQVMSPEAAAKRMAPASRAAAQARALRRALRSHPGHHWIRWSLASGTYGRHPHLCLTPQFTPVSYRVSGGHSRPALGLRDSRGPARGLHRSSRPPEGTRAFPTGPEPASLPGRPNLVAPGLIVPTEDIPKYPLLVLR